MKWLNRDLIVGPYLALATSEQAFDAIMKRCKVSAAPPWVSEGADATAHYLKNPLGEMVCIVGIRVTGQTPVQIAAMLVHEAVHIWQAFCEDIGEDAPSSEFEAYSIQMISQRLMQAYADEEQRK